MLDAHKLRIFAAVSELKSFSLAARKLFLTQPTVSQHISALEEHIGLPLLDRNGKNVSLTRAGELLYRYAKQISEISEEAQQALDFFKGRKSGHIALGASTIPGEYILPGLMGTFCSQYPGIKTTLRIADTEDIVRQLLDREIEFGIIGARVSGSRLQFTDFMEDELVVVVPRGHRWWDAGRVDLSDLTAEPFVMRESGSGTRISLGKRLQELGLHPGTLTVAAEVGSTTAVKEAVRAGLGISIVSAMAVRDEERHKQLKVVRIGAARILRTFYFVQDRRRALSPLAEAFIAFLQQQSLTAGLNDPA